MLGIPRGGLVVAYEVATELNALLDVFMLRKLGVPGHEELAFGAIAIGGVRVLDRHVIQQVQEPCFALEQWLKPATASMQHWCYSSLGWVVLARRLCMVDPR